MMKSFNKYVLLLGMACAQAYAGDASSSLQVRICEDSAEWPPYSYVAVENCQRTERVEGLAVDIAREILESKGVEFQLDLHPWKRCLHEVARGEQYQMVLSASSNEERRATYLFSEPYYETHPYYFYSKKQYPEGLQIQSLKDLARYTIGGIAGYNYEYLGVTSDQVNWESIDYRHLILKLHHRKVDVFVEQIEIIRGFDQVGKNFLDDPDLGYAPLPDMEPTPFHMLFTNDERGAELKRIVDEGLQQLRQSGRRDQLFKRYFP